MNTKGIYIKLDHWDSVFALVCFAASFFLYYRTLTPGLLYGDSGEFQTLAYLLGDTHPTGYPVYLVLAKLATLLPLGDVAYRVNLFSALMGSITVLGVYLTGRLLVKYRVLSLIGSLVFAISPTFWSQAIIAEVYTAGAAFLVFIVLALLWWDQTKTPKALFVAGLLGGLSLGIHMSVALLAPAILLFLLLHWRRGKKMWVSAFLGALSGVLLTILFFWLIDLNNPTANYFNSVIEPSRSSWDLTVDEIDDPLERLYFGWTARQFRSFMFADIGNVMPRQASNYWQNLPLELGYPLIWFAILGAVVMLIRRMRVGILLNIALAIQLFYTFNYEIWDLYVFYISGYILLVLLAIFGGSAVIGISSTLLAKFLSGRQIRWSAIVIESIVALLVIGYSFLPVLSPQKEAFLNGEIPFNFDEYPEYDDSLLAEVHATVLKLPERAIVFTDWDMVWPYYYAAHIIEDRRDLQFIETYPADDLEGVADSVMDYVTQHLEINPIFFSEREPSMLKAGFSFSPARVGPTRLLRVLDD
jgi:hypothetical protein